MYFSDLMKAVMVMQMWYKVQILFKNFLRKCEVLIFWKFSFLTFEIEIYEKNGLKLRIWHCKVSGNQLWKTFQIVDSHTHLTRSGYLRIELVAFYQDPVLIFFGYMRNSIAFKIFDKIMTCCILYFVGGYISSQYLLGSSLSQDVNQFDFNSPADAYKSYAVMTTDDGGIYSEGSQNVRKSFSFHLIIWQVISKRLEPIFISIYIFPILFLIQLYVFFSWSCFSFPFGIGFC